MINVEKFLQFLKKKKINFFTGIPDSILKEFCTFLDDNYTIKNHIVSANEGSALALAAGYNLATNKIPLIYLQNSGFGNMLNPLLSLVDGVYSIPCIILMDGEGQTLWMNLSIQLKEK